MVQDLSFTETAWHADVVPPASSLLDEWGSFTNTNRQVQIARPVLDPPGDARHDWWILQQIARRPGLDWRYAHPREGGAGERGLDPGPQARVCARTASRS